ncbi:RmlD substrate binding domain protein [Aquimixticola soesokkakensis]|uniref:dTDP-4-dehydrorhamnose reductase n=1 Tax=Aquimixticola soesokkakensis TaxID=1519096 RepID=A0A1Y5R6M3_9RHOB|nr:sugar nucleotide-binding protein [Aquimixticola soesokkakensis]SLN10057.1 RmlD substrate binding domain protein [Aquimixticola soesokkakensis]
MARVRILLTGANGQLGRLFCAVIETAFPHVEVVKATRHTAWTLARPLAGMAALGAIDAVVHLAAPTPAGHVRDYGETVDLACAAQSVAQALGARLIVMSSQAVYGAPRGHAFRETDPIAPQNDYGRAKAAMEAALDPDCLILRLGNVVGTDQLGRNLRSGETIQLDRFAEGFPVRSYIGPMTLCRVLVGLAHAKETGVYNLAAPVPVEMGALVAAFGGQWHAGPLRAGPAVIALDVSKIAAIVSFSAQENLPLEMVTQFTGLAAALGATS